MSALSIIVGGWLLLNAVVFAALMLRRDRPALRNRLFLWVVDGRRETEEGRAVELRTLPIAHQFPRLPIPIEIRPHVGPAD